MHAQDHHYQTGTSMVMLVSKSCWYGLSQHTHTGTMPAVNMLVQLYDGATCLTTAGSAGAAVLPAAGTAAA